MAVTDFDPQLVMLETTTPLIPADLALSREIKQFLPQTRLPLSGRHVSARPSETLGTAPYIDFFLLGEYEYTLRDLTPGLGDGTHLDQVNGMLWQASKRTIYTNPPKPLIKNIEELPWPARHLSSIANYCDSFASLPTPGLNVWASRGYPFLCIFYVWPNVIYGSRLIACAT